MTDNILYVKKIRIVRYEYVFYSSHDRKGYAERDAKEELVVLAEPQPETFIVENFRPATEGEVALANVGRVNGGMKPNFVTLDSTMPKAAPRPEVHGE